MVKLTKTKYSDLKYEIEQKGASHFDQGEAFRHITDEPESEIYRRNASPLQVYLQK